MAARPTPTFSPDENNAYSSTNRAYGEYVTTVAENGNQYRVIASGACSPPDLGSAGGADHSDAGHSQRGHQPDDCSTARSP